MARKRTLILGTTSAAFLLLLLACAGKLSKIVILLEF